MHLSAAREVLLIADDVTKSYDEDKQLFSGLTFSVVEGDKLAICGMNGSGKSTLLKIMAGLDEFDAGSMQRNMGAKVGYLMQEPKMNESHTVLQAVLQSDSAVAKAVQSYQKAVASSSGDMISKDLEKAIELMNAFSPMSWEIDAEAKRILNSVGISDKLFASPVSKLSGGQRKRVALASCLLGKPDLLVLDEPTNHMDIEIIGWMEKELKTGSMAVVLVTHDRHFMESVCSRILELDNGKAVMHDFGGPGAYDRFREAREFRRKSQANAAQDARTLFRREAEWIAKQPKARQAKSQARVNAFVDLTARTRDMPKEDVKVDFGSASMMRQGNKVVKMIDISYQPPGFTVPLIRAFNYDFMPGERLGIVGRNGAGKSTLLNLIAGLIPPSSGTREVGETTVVGYFTQYPPEVRGDLRVINYIKEIADDSKARLAGIENMDTPEMLLEKVGFSRQRQYQYVSSLSGGERRRLHLASVLVERPNLLILDEPTNDLDLQTVEVVEEVVRGFKGVLLVVSHDRAFMDNLCPKLLVLNGQDGAVRMFQGEYSEYLSILEQEKEAVSSERLAQSSSNASKTSFGTPPAAPPATRKISWAETQEYKKIQGEIVKLSKEKDKLNKEVMALAQSGPDMAKLEKTSVVLGLVVEKIEKLEKRWMTLAELAGDL